MTKEELLDHLALEVLRVSPQSARDAYHVAEDMIERRQEILSKWAMNEAIVFDGIGRKSINEIIDCLNARGLKLRGEE